MADLVHVGRLEYSHIYNVMNTKELKACAKVVRKMDREFRGSLPQSVKSWLAGALGDGAASPLLLVGGYVFGRLPHKSDIVSAVVNGGERVVNEEGCTLIKWVGTMEKSTSFVGVSGVSFGGVGVLEDVPEVVRLRDVRGGMLEREEVGTFYYGLEAVSGLRFVRLRGSFVTREATEEEATTGHIPAGCEWTEDGRVRYYKLSEAYAAVRDTFTPDYVADALCCYLYTQDLNEEAVAALRYYKFAEDLERAKKRAEAALERADAVASDRDYYRSKCAEAEGRLLGEMFPAEAEAEK